MQQNNVDQSLYTDWQTDQHDEFVKHQIASCRGSCFISHSDYLLRNQTFDVLWLKGTHIMVFRYNNSGNRLCTTIEHTHQFVVEKLLSLLLSHDSKYWYKIFECKNIYGPLREKTDYSDTISDCFCIFRKPNLFPLFW